MRGGPAARQREGERAALLDAGAHPLADEPGGAAGHRFRIRKHLDLAVRHGSHESDRES